MQSNETVLNDNNINYKVCKRLLNSPSDLLQMSVLSRQVTAVSQELQEVTRLLKPLFHNTSTLLMPGAVTPPPNVCSNSCSPAPFVLTQHATADCSDDQNPPSIKVSEESASQGGSDPLQNLPFQNPPLVSHCSAPPSLNSYPHEHPTVPHANSSFIPCLSSASLPSPTMLDLLGSGPQTEPSYQSQPQFQPLCISQSYRDSHSQPLFQPSSMTPLPQEPLVNLEEELQWGQSPTQLSFIDEGQPSMWTETSSMSDKVLHDKQDVNSCVNIEILNLNLISTNCKKFWQ